MIHISKVIESLFDRYETRHNPLLDMPYAEYLQTEHWQRVRRMKLNRADHRCEKCRATKYLHVHHKTYEHRGMEDYHLNDLMVLCDICHRLEHARMGEDVSGWELAKE